MFDAIKETQNKKEKLQLEVFEEHIRYALEDFGCFDMIWPPTLGETIDFNSSSMIQGRFWPFIGRFDKFRLPAKTIRFG